jgi:conjugative relaxase-like TrwC/TraI family protein
MLRLKISDSAAAAKQYYTEGLTRAADYYLHGQGITGQWCGVAAAQLGLSGEVKKEDFFALLDNIYPEHHPQAGETLTARQKKNRRPGGDLTFNAPKGFSVLRQWTQDPALADAFKTAVEDTLQYDAEPLIQTRVRKDGAFGNRTTGNMACAVFYDTLARPVNGIEDMHDHAHAYIPNLTWDPEEQRFKAIEYYDLHLFRPYLEACFHARLSALVQSLGYPTQRYGKWWDVALSDSILEKFSRRTTAIEKRAKELGIIDGEGNVLDQVAMAALGASTRDNKAKSNHLSPEALRAAWWGRLTPAEKRALMAVAGGNKPDGAKTQARRTSLEEALDYGIADVFPRKSVVSDLELMEPALRRGFGGVLPEDLKPRIAAGYEGRLIPVTIDGRIFVTTQEAAAEEDTLKGHARACLDRYAPLHREGFTYRNPALNDGQNAAVRHVLTSTDGILMIEGGAGVGKTTLARAAEAEIREGGKQVFFFAPTATAARDTLAEHFPEANTVAYLLKNEVLHQRLRGQVLWIDEAGQLGAQDMNRVLALAKRLDCRVILSGDTKQHAPVARGDAMRLLKRAGIRPAEVTEIVRQSGQYKDAVAAIKRGDLAIGFDLLDHLGWIREVPRELLYTLPAEDAVWYRRADKNALVVEPTHRGGEQVTQVIRDALKQEGTIETEERPFWVLRNLSWEAEKRDPARYRPGLVVQYVSPDKGIKQGGRYQITGKDEQGRMWAVGRDGKPVILPLNHPERFQVYEPRHIGVAIGDTIQITQNGKTEDGHKVSNGGLYQVTGFTKAGDLKLGNGWVLARDFAHFTHGYYLTSHKSQSKTVPMTLAAIGAEAKPAVCAEQFYVTVSRGKEGVRIYTDDKEALKRNILRSSQRPSATELIAGEVTREGMLKSVVEEMQAAARRYQAYQATLKAGRGEAALALVKDARGRPEAFQEGRTYGGPVMER